MPRALRVLQSFPTPVATTNPYIVMLAERLVQTPGVELSVFSARTALVGRYDVFHAHWPEAWLGGRTPLRTVARHLVYALFLLRLTVFGTPIVRTMHNLELPQGISRPTRMLLRWVEWLTACRILINATTELPAGTTSRTILHGHYRDWFAKYPRPESSHGRLTFFGLVRRYKGVDQLVTAFRGVSDDTARLRVAGKPSTPQLAADLEAEAADDPRISFRFEFLDDADLVAEAGAAELITLPYREMHNSGAALTALSLDRPVLVPDNEANRSLAAEVGPGWVHRYSGQLTAQVLMDALSDLRADPPRVRPDLSARDWDTTGQRHLECYRQAIQERPGPFGLRRGGRGRGR